MACYVGRAYSIVYLLIQNMRARNNMCILLGISPWQCHPFGADIPNNIHQYQHDIIVDYDDTHDLYFPNCIQIIPQNHKNKWSACENPKNRNYTICAH